RGAPRLCRGAPNVWGVWGAISGPQKGARLSRSATGFPGRSERWGVWGAISGPPMSSVPTRAVDQIQQGRPGQEALEVFREQLGAAVVVGRQEARHVGRDDHAVQSAI